jgi:large subunit ribosomal protein L11
MAKEIIQTVKLQVPAGRATPGPPLGPALSQYGVNAGEFSNQFNEKTKEMQNGLVLRVLMTIYNDRTFKFEIKGSPASELIKQALKKQKGSGKPNLQKIGKLTRAQVEEIAKEKMVDLNTRTLEEATKIIEGTARQMGVEVEKA